MENSLVKIIRYNMIVDNLKRVNITTNCIPKFQMLNNLTF